MTIGYERCKQARKDAPKNAGKRKSRNRAKRGLVETNLGKTLKAERKGGIIKRVRQMFSKKA